MVVHAHHGSWVMVKGACCCCRHSCISMGTCCGGAPLALDGLVVGLVLVYALWMVVVVCEQLLHLSSWVVVLWVHGCGGICLWLVICGQLSGLSLWAVVACWWVIILGADCGCGWLLAITAAVSLSLWPFVVIGVCGHSLFVTVGGCCGQLLLVVMCAVGHDGERRGHVTLPNKSCLLFITNKLQTNK